MGAREHRKWTDDDYETIRQLAYDGLSDPLIGVRFGCSGRTIGHRRRMAGIAAAFPKAGYYGPKARPTQVPRQQPSREPEPDRRDLTGQFFGDPQPSRSALMQVASANAADRPRVTLGTMPSRDSIGRIKGGGALTYWLRIKRDKSNGGGAQRAIAHRQARREREARA